MSEMRLLAAAAGLALACAGALPAQQDAALLARRNELRARADSLHTRFEALEATARDSGLTAEIPAGPLRLRTTTALQPVATAAFTQAVAEAHRVLGADADSLAGHPRARSSRPQGSSPRPQPSRPGWRRYPYPRCTSGPCRRRAQTAAR